MNEDLLKTYGDIPGMKEFLELFNTPDEIFDAMYPSLKQSLEDEFKKPEFIKELKEAQEMQDFINQTDYIENLREEINKFDGMSANKKELLNLLLLGVIQEPFDAEIKINLVKNVETPNYNNLLDASMNIYMPEDITIKPNTYSNKIKLGFKVEIPANWHLVIYPDIDFSNLVPIRFSNGFYIVDPTDIDELYILVDHFGTSDSTIKKGTCIAQMKLEPNYKIKWK